MISFTFYEDMKQNCSRHDIQNSYCYNGPLFDNVGQYKSCAVPGTLALTFDDAPDMHTEGTLDILKKYNIKATFFLIGKNIDSYVNVVQRIVDEGHQIGCHTYDHGWLTNMTSDDIRKDLMLFEHTLIKHDFGGVLSNHQTPSIFRAPHGALDNEGAGVLKEFNLTSFHWSFLNGDSTIKRSSDIVQGWYAHMGGEYGTNVDDTRLKLIVQQHEKMDVTFFSLSDVCSYLSQTFQRLKFVTLSDCVGNLPAYHTSSVQLNTNTTCLSGFSLKHRDMHFCAPDPAPLKPCVLCIINPCTKIYLNYALLLFHIVVSLRCLL